jgi:membrane protease YdiL (CAAX protease family)
MVLAHLVGNDQERAEMSSTSIPSEHWQGKAWTQLLAAALGVLPLYLGLVIVQLLTEQISIQAFTLYLTVIAPLAIVTALLLLRFLCGETLRDLNRGPGKPATDLLAVLVLSLVIVIASVISTYFLSELLPDSRSDTSVKNLFRELAANPGLLVLFAGPLFFLGAASEELIRAFLLSRLWKVWPSTPAKLVAIVISACLFGLIHLYQGPIGAGWTAIFGLIMAFYYLRFGRVVPLIVAHYLTNALQVVVFSALAR